MEAEARVDKRYGKRTNKRAYNLYLSEAAIAELEALAKDAKQKPSIYLDTLLLKRATERKGQK